MKHIAFIDMARILSGCSANRRAPTTSGLEGMEMKSTSRRWVRGPVANCVARNGAAFSLLAGVAFAPMAHSEPTPLAQAVGSAGDQMTNARNDASAFVDVLGVASAAQGDVYEQALQRLTLGHAEELLARVASSQFTEASWREDAVAAFALARLTEGSALETLSNLPGLQPRIYLEARRREPTALRDLRALVAQGQLSNLTLAEVVWRRASRVSLSAEADFPGAEQKSYATWRAEEYAALVDGLILVLGQAEERAVHFVLRDLLLDPSLAMRHRAAAATALGQTGSDLAEGALARSVASADPVLREGALTGLGRLGSSAAIQMLGARVSSTSPQNDFRVAVSALGRAGSHAVRERRASSEDDARTEAVVDALVFALGEAKDPRDVQATIEAICVVADAGALAKLEHAALKSAEPTRYNHAVRRLRRTLKRLGGE